MVMRRCALCASPARIYCESDQASLCWNCDFKVHGTNFLVARHSRTLLCHGCQSLTPWSASGRKLGPTVSMCRKCCGDDDDEIDGGDGVDEIDGRDEVDLDGDEVEDNDVDDVSEDEGDNQVVPWSTVTPTPPSPSCSSSDEEFSVKRNRGSSSDLRFQENNGRSIRRREINLTVETAIIDDLSFEGEITRREKIRTTEPGFGSDGSGSNRIEIAELIKPAGIID